MTTDAAREGFEAWARKNKLVLWQNEDRSYASNVTSWAWAAYQAALASAGQQQARVAELEAKVERLRGIISHVHSAATDTQFVTPSDALGYIAAHIEGCTAALARQAGG